MKVKIIALLIFAAISATAQQDEKAKKILDKLAEKNKTNETIIAEFTLNYNNLQSEHENSSDGKIIMKGEKYKLDFRNSVIYYNGKTMWSYLKEVNEVNISEPAENPDNQDIMNHPNQIFELYEQDFKYKYKGTESKNNHNLYVVDLFPKDLDKDYSRIKLKVEQENYRIHSAKVFGKDGSRYTFIINKLTTNKPIKNSTFEFDKSAHPDVEVIDMRF